MICWEKLEVLAPLMPKIAHQTIPVAEHTHVHQPAAIRTIQPAPIITKTFSASPVLAEQPVFGTEPIIGPVATEVHVKQPIPSSCQHRSSTSCCRRHRCPRCPCCPSCRRCCCPSYCCSSRRCHCCPSCRSCWSWIRRWSWICRTRFDRSRCPSSRCSSSSSLSTN